MPKPADEMTTDEMTSTIFGAFESVLQVMRIVQPFTNGDVMSAALHVLIDAGMRAVENGTCDKETLIKDICAAIPGAVNEWRAPGEEERTLQ